MESNLSVTRNINTEIDSKHYFEIIIHNASSCEKMSSAIASNQWNW